MKNHLTIILAITELIAQLLAFIIALTFHEFCHAASAYALGDDTAQKAGRLTLNPLSHLDPLGLLCLIFLKIGWARPVPFNPYNFRYPRLGAIIVGLSGPCANLFLACATLITLQLLPLTIFTYAGGNILRLFILNMVNLNIILALFNLIPIPPLDGGHLIMSLLPTKYYHYYGTIIGISLILLIVLIMTPSFHEIFFEKVAATRELLEALVEKII